MVDHDRAEEDAGCRTPGAAGTDLRVCFLGDSFVAGVGDPQHLGWAGRLAARSSRSGRALTTYNLGVRRDTSRDVSTRWRRECTPRLSAGVDGRVVLSLGVNDTAVDDVGPRVAHDESAANLAGLLRGMAAQGWPVLVVGPPPVADPEHTARTAALDAAFSSVCAAAAVAYVPVLEALRTDTAWAREVAAGDGAHPGAEGYQELADRVWPRWWHWTTRGATSD